MSINNLSVGARLGAGFALILLLLMMMGSSAFWLTRENEQSVNDMITLQLQKERLAGEWSRIIDKNNGFAMTAMSTTDPQLRAAILAAMNEGTIKATETYEKLKPLLQSETGRKLLNDALVARQKYRDLRKEGLDLAEQGLYNQVGSFMSDKFYPATEEYSKAIQAMTNYQMKLIDESYIKTNKDSTISQIIIVTFILISIVMGSLIAWFITRSITHPLARAVNVAGKVSAGDLTVAVEVHSRDQLGQLMHSLRTMVQSLSSTVSNVRSGAESIAFASNDIDAGNRDLASRTEEQAASVEETATTLEQLASTIKNTAQNAHRVNDLFNAAGQVITRNSKRMHDVSARMQDINTAAQKMTDIITVIEGIAFQTNILALNAAVEAARAGEQGRGFAVVAGEVRTLAQRSSTSAKEIRDIIGTTINKISGGRELVSDADKGMQDIVEKVAQVQLLVDEIARASTEQSDGISQINQAMGQIDTTTQQNASLVEESSAATGSLKEQVRILMESIQAFTLEDAHNLAEAEPETARPLPAIRKEKMTLPPASNTNWGAF